jgi:hypothetical protein
MVSALGIGQFVLNDGAQLEFPPALQMHFDFREAFSVGTITEISCPSNFVDAQNIDTLRSEMAKLRMIATPVDCVAAPWPGHLP